VKTASPDTRSYPPPGIGPGPRASERGQTKNGNVRESGILGLTDASRHLESVESGHLNIHDDHIRKQLESTSRALMPSTHASTSNPAAVR
jgi:hypothetical protein